jgi:squalene synthase HpnC
MYTVNSLVIMRRMHTAFERDLHRYGPQRTAAPPRAAEAQAYCSRLARRHYENFTVASLMLPRRLLRHFHAVYAYCRWADDLADEVGDGTRSLELLNWWRGELLRCYDGEPTHPVMIALRPTIRRFRIPPEPFLDLLTAFEQDQRVRRYDTFGDLLGYCRFSANPVGRLVLYLGEAFSIERAVLADHVCTGLQLANFWQDVSRDLDIGRVYLPHEDLARFGCTEEDLAARRFTPVFREMMRFEVARAREMFDRGAPLVSQVPVELQADVELIIACGRGILNKIEAAGYNVLARRPVLAKWEKAAMLCGVMWRRLRSAMRLW